jgi:hypothetical protein
MDDLHLLQAEPALPEGADVGPQCTELPHGEQVKLAVHIAVGEALSGKPAALGEMWLKVEDLGRRRDMAKDIAAKYAGMAKAQEQERELLLEALTLELQGREVQSADAGYGFVRRQLNGGNLGVKITGPVPVDFMKVKHENDVKKIGEALRKGDILTFAELEKRSERLVLEPL